MMLVQRSGDMLTASGAGGMNEIQYAALLMMIAKHTGYKAGVFSHVVANEQIYDRHLDAAREMLRRYEEKAANEPADAPDPQISLETDKTDFYSFTIEDFKLRNYSSIKPQLVLDLGI